ncbi:MAG: Rrf2 family transcriptional regulator [Pseudomonadota bacterium]
MKVSTRARYAMRFMIDLADHSHDESPVILGDIAKRQQISKRYLEQIATNLKNAHLVSPTSGRGGGYRLRRSPKEIKVGEILRATIGEFNLVECVTDPKNCSRSQQCPSRKMWVELNEKIDDFVNTFTLSDLCEGGEKGMVAAATLGGGGPCIAGPQVSTNTKSF